MATKYLDNSGLSYFWGKIKSYIANLLSLKADDSAVMHLAGTEIVTGVKTFSSGSIVLTNSSATTPHRLTITSNTSSYIGLWDSTKSQWILYATPAGSNVFKGNADTATDLVSNSDEQLKTPLKSLSADFLNVWEKIEWGEFKFLKDIEDSKDKAKYHFGLIAQSIKRIFENNGLDSKDYDFLVYNEEENTWMLKYVEALCIEAAYQRRKNKILEKRISDLEEQLFSVLETLKKLNG